MVNFAMRFPKIFVLTCSDLSRVAEVVRGHGGPQPKSLDSDENFKPEHTLLCRELRFVAIYTLFGDRTKIFMAIFAPDERLPSSATLP